MPIGPAEAGRLDPDDDAVGGTAGSATSRPRAARGTPGTGPHATAATVPPVRRAASARARTATLRSSAMSTEPVSYWLAASRRGPHRPALRGIADADVAIVGRLHRAVDGESARRRRPRAGCRETRAGGGRVRGERAERRVCAASLTHGARTASCTSPTRSTSSNDSASPTWPSCARSWRRRASTATSSGPAPSAWPPSRGRPRSSSEARDLPADSRLPLLRPCRDPGGVHSPRFLAGSKRARAQRDARPGEARPGPRGGRGAARRPVHEDTRVRRLDRRAGGVRVTTDDGAILDAGRVVVATSAYSGWLRRLVPLFVPVYDYVLVTEPLTPDSARRSAGRDARVSERLPIPLLPPDRGRPDPVGRLRRRLSPGQRGQARVRPAPGDVRARSRSTSARPSRSSRTSRFPYRWGGAIDTTTRFCVTFGETHRRAGRLRARLHRPGRRGGALGGERRPRLAPAPRLGAAPARASSGARRSRSRPNRPHARGRADAPRDARADANEGRRVDHPARRWTRWKSASTRSRTFSGPSRSEGWSEAASTCVRRPAASSGGGTQRGSSRASVASGSDP